MPDITHVLIHEHRFGASCYPVCITGLPPAAETVAKAMKLDFEADNDEYLELVPLDRDIFLWPALKKPSEKRRKSNG